MPKKKAIKSEIKPDWTLLSEEKSPKIDILFKLYAEDKEKARIYFFLNRGHFSSTRKVLFEEANGDFRFAIIRKTYGISINSRMYSRETSLETISYSKNKFHYYNHEKHTAYVRQLTYMGLRNFCIRHNNSWDTGNPNNSYETIMTYFTNKFGWIRYVAETQFWGTAFNVILKKKLFNLKAMHRHQYDCPYPVAKFINEYTTNQRAPHKFHGVWREMRKQLINIESLTEESFLNPLFQDSCRMAQMVGEKVNCSWSHKRLKSEHDKWSKVITKVMLEHEELRNLSNASVYKEFAEFTKDDVHGFELLTTNHQLIEEGTRMNHCVATYGYKVDEGTCGIYRVGGCTLELRVGEYQFLNTTIKDLRVAQLRNYGNSEPPKELRNLVNSRLADFNTKYCDSQWLFESGSKVMTEALPF